MDTLKVLEAQSRTEACWKTFKERTLTKKNARENLLLNSDFNCLLHSLLYENNERVWKIALEFVLNCVKGKMISSTAFLTLLQQKLPQSTSSKIDSIPILERAAVICLNLEEETEIDFCLQLATSDLRIIPFITEKIINCKDFSLAPNFIEYLLGNPKLCFGISDFNNLHYKSSRCRILAFLATTIVNEESLELLSSFLIWNSSRICSLELSNITLLIEYFANNPNDSDNYFDLFEVYVETLCNGLMKFGLFSDNIEQICLKADHWINESIAFRLGSLLLLISNPNSSLLKNILKVIRKFQTLNDFAKVICSNLMPKLIINSDEELISCIKAVFASSPCEASTTIEIISESFNDFGAIVRLGCKGLRPSAPIYEKYFDLIALSNNLNSLSSISISRLVQEGHFETIFGLFAFKWTCSDCDFDDISKGFLQLLGDIDRENSEGKVLRYSWVVDFFETNFDDELYLKLLPLICDNVSNSDNILFAFVQQKLSLYLSQKESVTIQRPCMLSLLSLFESSQSRQSRLNFLTTSALSFLQGIIQKNILSIDSSAVFICLKLLSNLSEIAVVDPRDIWSKYVTLLLQIPELTSDSYVTGAISCFSSSLSVIPDGLEFQFNEIKVAAVKFLLDKLSVEEDEFVLEQVCEALSKFSIESLKGIELSLLKPKLMDSDDEFEKIESDTVLLSKSNIFNPSLLFEISRRYKTIRPYYIQLWTRLVDFEVEHMPRTLFLGSNEAVISRKNDSAGNYVSHPSFFNGILFEQFNDIEINSTVDVVKCIKTRLCPLIPSLSTLLWFIRPHFPIYFYDSVEKLFKMIDDQRILKDFSSFEFLLSELRIGNTPQASCNLILIISAIMKFLFTNQNISENFLFSNWISMITERLTEMSEFKSLLINDEFLASVAVSCNILFGCSREIDSALSVFLLGLIINNTKVKDGVAVYCGIEAISKLNNELVQTIISDKAASSKRKLIGIFALQRLKINVENLEISEKSDDLSLLLEKILKKDFNEAPKISVDPLDFKGLGSYIQSLHSKEDLLNISKQRAFDSGNVPSSLKFDSILAYLLGSKMDFLALKVDSKQLKILESSTKDSKCLALIQFLSKTSEKDTEMQVVVSGLGRFDQNSWLKFISSTDLKYNVLKNCKLLPRISWEPVPLTDFEFTLKHVLSVTPITNVPYINPSLLSSFLDNVSDYLEMATYAQLSRIINVLTNNSDERSLHFLVNILKNALTQNNSDRLSTIISEYKKYSPVSLKSFDVQIFNELKPENIAANSRVLIELTNLLDINPWKLNVFDLKSGLFGILKEILCCEDFGDRLNILALQLNYLTGKEKLKFSIDIIDLIFVYQKDEQRFDYLLGLLNQIFEDVDSIFIEAKNNLSDPILVAKIRSRSALIPQDIYARLELYLSALEFEKESF